MKSQAGGIFGWVIGMGLLLLVIFFIGGAFVRSIFSTAATTGGAVLGATTEENRQITVSDLMKDTIVYQGLTVTVEGAISDWVSKQGFLISEPRGFATGGVMVLNSQEYDLPEYVTEDELALGEKGPVRIRGRVEQFDLAQAEAELGVDLPDEAYAGWKKRPVIILESLEKITSKEATDAET